MAADRPRQSLPLPRACRRALLPWLGAATLIAFALGLNQAYRARPTTTSRARRCKIMYIHVPSAWLAHVGCWTVMSDRGARHAGVAPSARRRRRQGRGADRRRFTLMCLVTGSLWGRPMWGTYWVWDARLTSVLVLFLMYLGVIALWRTIEDPRAPRARRRSSRWSAPSTCRSSSSRSTGGTRCTSRPRCCGSAARPSIPRSCMPLLDHGASPSCCCSSRCILPPCATRSCGGACARC